jgi:hypothetical protein
VIDLLVPEQEIVVDAAAEIPERQQPQQQTEDHSDRNQPLRVSIQPTAVGSRHADTWGLAFPSSRSAQSTLLYSRATCDNCRAEHKPFNFITTESVKQRTNSRAGFPACTARNRFLPGACLDMAPAIRALSRRIDRLVLVLPPPAVVFFEVRSDSFLKICKSCNP